MSTGYQHKFYAVHASNAELSGVLSGVDHKIIDKITDSEDFEIHGCESYIAAKYSVQSYIYRQTEDTILNATCMKLLSQFQIENRDLYLTNFPSSKTNEDLENAIRNANDVQVRDAIINDAYKLRKMKVRDFDLNNLKFRFKGNEEQRKFTDLLNQINSKLNSDFDYDFSYVSYINITSNIFSSVNKRWSVSTTLGSNEGFYITISLNGKSKCEIVSFRSHLSLPSNISDIELYIMRELEDIKPKDYFI